MWSINEFKLVLTIGNNLAMFENSVPFFVFYSSFIMLLCKGYNK